MQIYLILNLDILQGSFRLCNWLSLQRLVSWINHLPPACCSTFWKSIFKHQLGCRFAILDSISSFVLYFDICNYICLDTSYHFWLYLYFLNIIYFFKYSCTNIFHRRSLCTFYSTWWYVFCKGPIYKVVISTWISNHMLRKMWCKITYPSPNFNRCTFEVCGQVISSRIGNYLSMLELK